MSGKEDEQRGRIDRAVIEAERDLAGLRHLARPHLMQDLAGLGIRVALFGARLRRGEELQHAPGQCRIGPEREERGDRAISAEGCREPWHPRIGVRPRRSFGGQHGEVGHRALEHLVEDGVVRLQPGVAGSGACLLAAAAPQRDQEAPARR
jgi:hypothetical protein